jgi:hypothetical protein
MWVQAGSPAYLTTTITSLLEKGGGQTAWSVKIKAMGLDLIVIQ